METIDSNFQNASGDLFIDQINAQYLREIAKWGKLLAIVGFVGLGLIIIFGVMMGLMMGYAIADLSSVNSNNAASAMGGVFFAIYMFAIAAIYFFPLYYLLKFSNAMKAALDNHDQIALNDSFKNLKSCFKFIGIFTAVVVAIYALALVITLVFGGIASLMQ